MSLLQVANYVNIDCDQKVNFESALTGRTTGTELAAVVIYRVSIKFHTPLLTFEEMKINN